MIALAALALGAVVTVGPIAAGPKRVAVVVGNNLGLAGELELAFAEADAQRVARALQDVGEFAPHDVHVLLDRGAQEVREVLGRVAREAAAAREPPLLFFYYSGHGDGTALHLSGSRLGLGELQELLGVAAPGLSVAVIDACKSGALTRLKGASPGPAYTLDVRRTAEAAGTVVIASSSEDELSQESAALEGSYFTHHWVAGLYGRADADGDGLVMLDEAYRYAHFRTVETTIASRGGVQHPSYSVDLRGFGGVVLATLHRSTAVLRIDPEGRGGRYFLLDPDKGLVLGEVSTAAGGPASIRLPPGTYRLRKREPTRALMADVTLKDGEVVTVRASDMVPAPLERVAMRGGDGVTALLPYGVPPAGHGPSVGVGLRSPLVPGMSVTTELSVGWEVAWERFVLRPRLAWRGTLGERSDLDSRSLHFEYDLGLEAHVPVDLGALWGWWSLRLGASAGLVFFDSVALERVAESADAFAGVVSVGFQGTASAGIVWARQGWEVGLYGQAGAAVFRHRRDVVHGAFVGGGTVRVGHRF